MLLHAILLLGSLAAAESARPCDTSLIHGVTAKEVSFDFYTPAGASASHLRVKCASDNSLKAIKLSSGPDAHHPNLYDSLTCDANKGWTAHMYSSNEIHHYKIAYATSPVTISCSAEYCAVEPYAEMYNGNTYGLSIVRRTSDDINTLNVDCPAGQELYAVDKKLGKVVLVADGKLSCSLVDAWTTSFAANTSATLQVECRDYSHCDPSLIKGIKADEINFSTDENHERVLTCSRNGVSHRMGIMIKDGDRLERFDSLQCIDRMGWYGHSYEKSTRITYGTKIPTHLTASCFEYCSIVSKTGLNIVHGEEAPQPILRFESLRITCTDKTQKLFFNGQHQKSDEAFCTMRHGWKSYDTLGKPENNPWEPQHVECRSDSTRGGKRFSRAMRTAEGKQEE